jgi:lipopolysaccharide export system protein LptA
VVPESEGAYTTYLGGGTVTLWCGDAVMTGDSAVHYETEERAEMIGNVVYRDTTRSLDADHLTYFEATDQIIADRNVRLVRLATGARLEGPHATFFRAAAADSRSIATGRPRMTIPATDPGGEPIIVDSDVAEFVGNERAFARGDVEIDRSDFHATADSAHFDRGEGRLYGDPVVISHGMNLAGDSIVTKFVDGDLDQVHALGNAHATGEDLDLRATEILIDIGPEDVEHAWAFGDGRSLGATGSFVIAGDSIDFAFAGGEIDSVTSVGEARAFQLNEERDPDEELTEPETTITAGADWLDGDRIRGWFEASSEAVDPESPRPQMRRLLALGSARSLFSGVRDSTATARRSRSYLLGSSIDILFVDGEPDMVVADQAIGIFLEPSSSPGETTRE